MIIKYKNKSHDIDLRKALDITTLNEKSKFIRKTKYQNFANTFKNSI